MNLYFKIGIIILVLAVAIAATLYFAEKASKSQKGIKPIKPVPPPPPTPEQIQSFISQIKPTIGSLLTEIANMYSTDYISNYNTYKSSLPTISATATSKYGLVSVSEIESKLGFSILQDSISCSGCKPDLTSFSQFINSTASATGVNFTSLLQTKYNTLVQDADSFSNSVQRLLMIYQNVINNQVVNDKYANTNGQTTILPTKNFLINNPTSVTDSTGKNTIVLPSGYNLQLGPYSMATDNKGNFYYIQSATNNYIGYTPISGTGSLEVRTQLQTVSSSVIPSGIQETNNPSMIYIDEYTVPGQEKSLGTLYLVFPDLILIYSITAPGVISYYNSLENIQIIFSSISTDNNGKLYGSDGMSIYIIDITGTTIAMSPKSIFNPEVTKITSICCVGTDSIYAGTNYGAIVSINTTTSMIDYLNSYSLGGTSTQQAFRDDIYVSGNTSSGFQIEKYDINFKTVVADLGSLPSGKIVAIKFFNEHRFVLTPTTLYADGQPVYKNFTNATILYIYKDHLLVYDSPTIHIYQIIENNDDSVEFSNPSSIIQPGITNLSIFSTGTNETLYGVSIPNTCSPGTSKNCSSVMVSYNLSNITISTIDLDDNSTPSITKSGSTFSLGIPSTTPPNTTGFNSLTPFPTNESCFSLNNKYNNNVNSMPPNIQTLWNYGNCGGVNKDNQTPISIPTIPTESNARLLTDCYLGNPQNPSNVASCVNTPCLTQSIFTQPFTNAIEPTPNCLGCGDNVSDCLALIPTSYQLQFLPVINGVYNSGQYWFVLYLNPNSTSWSISKFDSTFKNPIQTISLGSGPTLSSGNFMRTRLFSQLCGYNDGTTDYLCYASVDNASNVIIKVLSTVDLSTLYTSPLISNAAWNFGMFLSAIWMNSQNKPLIAYSDSNKIYLWNLGTTVSSFTLSTGVIKSICITDYTKYGSIILNGVSIIDASKFCLMKYDINSSLSGATLDTNYNSSQNLATNSSGNIGTITYDKISGIHYALVEGNLYYGNKTTLFSITISYPYNPSDNICVSSLFQSIGANSTILQWNLNNIDRPLNKFSYPTRIDSILALDGGNGVSKCICLSNTGDLNIISPDTTATLYQFSISQNYLAPYYFAPQNKSISTNTQYLATVSPTETVNNPLTGVKFGKIGMSLAYFLQQLVQPEPPNLTFGSLIASMF